MSDSRRRHAAAPLSPRPRGLSRRTLLAGLGALGAAGIAGAAGTAAASGPTTAAGTLPLTIANNSGKYGNDAVWIYIVGNQDNKQVHVKPDGTLAPVAASDNGPDGYTDYAIPLAASGDTKITLPQMSGRIYVALGEKLKFKAVTGGDGAAALQYPAGWVSSDPNYKILHDCAEFTFNGSGMFCNTTAVDMFSVPMSLHLKGAQDQTTGELKDGARAQVFSDVKAAAGFEKLVVDDLRVIAPGHGIDSQLFAADYFDGYIGKVWDAYAGKNLTVTTNAGAFTGKVSGGKLSFTGPAAVSFDKPSTSDVLYCNGALAAPNDGTTGPVAAVLGAAFNRSTLLTADHQPTTDPSGFYTDATTNHYAKAMHAAMKDGKAYGFAFDDVGGFASYIQDQAPSALTLNLTAF